MKKILGLDLGTTSIGWSFVQLDGSNSKIDSGVRIVPLTTNEKDEFGKGNAISTNASRTQKRTARKTLDRYQLRRERLERIFHKLGWLSSSTPILDTSTHGIWFTRAKAASERIELKDFALVLLHMNKKRGFKSNRKGTEDKEESAFKEAISNNDREVLNGGFTIGQWYVHQLQTGELSIHTRFKGLTFSRQLHREEFDKIWTIQSKFHPELTEKLKKQIGDYTIFYQRRLKSQKRLVNRCTFNSSHRAIPVSHPLFELFRAWHEVNHLRVTDSSTNTPWELDLPIKQVLINELSKTDILSSSGIKKILKSETGEAFNKYKLSVEKLPGMVFLNQVNKALGTTGIKPFNLGDLNLEITGNAFDKQPLLMLWHILHSIEEEEDVVAAIKKHFGYPDEVIDRLTNIRLKPGYGALCAKTIKKIMPYLMDGMRYDEAAKAAGFNHSFSINKQEKEDRILADQLALLNKGELRNPVVEKILNQMIHVVNAILKDPDLGRPDEIHIEMARELTATAKQRDTMYKQNIRSQKENEAIRKMLYEEFGLKKVSRNDIIKYRLGEECNWVSIYTGKPISKQQVFQTNTYDIEHIIPRSRLFDDSYGNKTLCEAEVNREKGNQTAYDYMESKGPAALEAFLKRVDELVAGKDGKISKGKANRLRMKRSDIPDDFISRQLNETRYIAREALQRMHLVCREIVPTSGSLTAYLRKEWGLEDMIKELNMHKYEALGQVVEHEDKSGRKSKRIVDWSKRSDHRHHALDAITVALTSRSMVQRANTLNQLAGDYERFDQTREFHHPTNKKKFEPEINNLRDLVKNALNQVLVSYKSGKRVGTWSTSEISIKGSDKQKRKIMIPRGPLHQETVYGQNLQYAQELVPLSKVDNPELIRDEQIRKAYLQHLQRFGGNAKEVFSAKSLKKSPLLVDGKEIHSVPVWESYYTQRVAVTDKLDVDKIIDNGVRAAVLNRLNAFNGDKKKAFEGLDTNPIWLNKEKGIAIKSVKIKARPNELLPLRHNGQKPMDFVVTGNNHHIAIYQPQGGKPYAKLVTLMEAIHRKQQGLPVIDTEPVNGDRFVVSLQQNEYFFFGNEEDLNSGNISPELFRVQKMSMNSSISPYLVFRHHLETEINSSQNFAMKLITSISKLPRYKLRLSHLGAVQDVEEILIHD